MRDGLKLPSHLSIGGGSIFHATWPASRWNRGVLCRHVRAYTAVYFINRQGLGPTLSPRVYTHYTMHAFARTSINVSLHPFGYISLLFLSPLLDSRRVPLAPQRASERRIPAVTRAARTTPLPFVDRLEYRRSDGNVTCSHQLPITATPNRVTKDRLSVNRHTQPCSRLRHPLILHFFPRSS